MSRDPAAIVAHLRTLESEDDGAAYLAETGAARDHDALVAVVWAAGMTRIEKLSKPRLIARIIKQTITARKKFRGLRQGWQ